AALALLTLIWGLSVPVTKLGLRAMSPLMLVALRYLSAAPFFVLLLRRLPRPAPRALAQMAALGVLGIGGGQVLQALGVQDTSASVATIISAQIPILTALLGSVRLRQPVRAPHIAGFLLALTGVVVAASEGTMAGTPDGLLGDGLMLLSGLCIACYYVFSTELAAREGVMAVAGWSSLAGAALMAPIAIVQAMAMPRLPSAASLAAVLYLGLLTTVLGLWIWLRAMRSLPVRIAAGSQYVQPLVGIIASALIFGDRLGPRFVLGSALVLGGIALSSLPGRR
ncbi:MAG: DMT family transporter, partial [Rhodospirillales bacterium]|nr:DMT family transporter [Rhodospirillales bacterium]